MKDTHDAQLSMTIRGRRVRVWVNPAAMVLVGRRWRRMKPRWVLEMEGVDGPLLGPEVSRESEAEARARVAQWIDQHLWGKPGGPPSPPVL